MSATLALNAVSAAIYTALNVSGLTALAPGGAVDDIAQIRAYPCVLFDVSEALQLGGFGTYPGAVGRLPEIALRVYVYSKHEGQKENQAVMAKVQELLAWPPTVSGHSACAIFWDDAIAVGDELIAGVKVKELTANARLYVEAA